MSLLIEEMDMPNSCHMCVAGFGGGCHFGQSADEYMCPDHGRADWCPLVELPPHGKLIDADKLIARLEKQRTVILHELPAAHEREEGYTKEDYIFDRNGDLISMLRNQAAVIPADTEVKRNAETKTTIHNNGGDASNRADRTAVDV